MTTPLSRRQLMGSAGTALGVAACSGLTARIVVVGGGFAGANAARTLKQLEPSLAVTVIEPSRRYVAAPGSNLVIVGELGIDELTSGFDDLRRLGIEVVHEAVTTIDTDRRAVLMAGGNILSYDRLIIAAGVSLRFDAISGLSQATAQTIPHGWLAGDQTTLLKRQLAYMPDGGTFILCPPAGPIQGPVAPYERASLIASWMSKHKPRAKLIIVDPSESFVMQDLFRDVWAEAFGRNLEWTGTLNHRIVRVDPLARSVTTEFGDTFTADVLNVIPSQRASNVTASAGLRDSSGWCPVNPRTFESALRPGVHVIGDAADLGPIPKTALTALIAGRLVAATIVATLRGREPPELMFASVLQALVTPDHGISTADVFRLVGGRWTATVGAGGPSPRAADAGYRKREAGVITSWIHTAIASTWGPAGASTTSGRPA